MKRRIDGNIAEELLELPVGEDLTKVATSNDPLVDKVGMFRVLQEDFRWDIEP